MFQLSVSANNESFLEMKNGDYSLKGYGSVTEELNSYGIDVFSYQLGTKENKALMISESEKNVYVYIYNRTGYSNYDKVSLAYYYGEAQYCPSLDSRDLVWEEMTIQLVSFDSTSMLQKYLIKELSFEGNTQFRSVYVREIYNNKNRQEQSYIFSVGMVYQYNPNTRQSKVDTEETIVVTRKKVAYEIYPQAENGIDSIWQRSYVAFSTDKKMDDLIEVKLKYNGFNYSAYTNIPLNSSSNEWDLKKAIQDFSSALTNKNVYDEVDSKRYFAKGKIFQDEQVSIKNEKINLSYSNGFLWSKTTGNWSYNTIEKTSNLKEKGVSLSDTSILDYDYVVSFDNRKVDCFTFGTGHYKVLWNEYHSVGGIMVGLVGNQKGSQDILYNLTWNPFATPSFKEESITHEVIQENTMRSDNQMLEVEDCTLLEFHYLDNGAIKHAIVVDTYNDSVGGDQFQDNNTDNVIDDIRDKFQNNFVFNGLEDFFKSFQAFFHSSVLSRAITIGVFVFVALIVITILYGAIKKSQKKNNQNSNGG